METGTFTQEILFFLEDKVNWKFMNIIEVSKFVSGEESRLRKITQYNDLVEEIRTIVYIICPCIKNIENDWIENVIHTLYQ